MHTGPITAVCCSKDNNRIFTGGYDKKVISWDQQTGDAKLLGSHEHLVNGLTMSNDGNLLASASSDYTINLYDIKTNKKVNTLKAHSDDVEDLAFNDNDTLLVSVSRDNRCLVWDVQTGAVKNEFCLHDKDVLSVWIKEDVAFTTGDDGKVFIWDITTSTLIKELGPFDYEIDTVAGSKELNLFAIGRDDGKVMFYNATSFELVQELKAHERGIKQVSFSPSGNLVLTAGYDHQIKVWNTTNFSLFRKLETTTYQWERSLAWSSDEKKVIGSSFGKKFNEWNVNTSKHVNKSEVLATPSINGIAIDQNNNVVSASDDGVFRLNGKEIAKSKGVLTNATSTSTNGEYLAWGDHAGEIHIVNKKTGHVESINLSTGPINTIVYDEFQNSFFIGTYGGYIHEVSLITLKESRSWDAHDGAVKALDLDENTIVSVSSEGVLYVFNKTKETVFKEFFGPLSIANDVTLDSSRNRIIVVSRDKVVRVFDQNSGQVINQHNRHRYSIKSVTSTSDGKIISGDYWGNIVIINEDNSIVGPLKIANNGLSSLVSYKNDVYASSYDGGIYKINQNNDVSEHLRLFKQ
ncbi:PQQ-binding-like beta-propeller repeat protein [Pseudalkalibacillus hwajinpoensis]|uniref:WD40 repeat domain-containing protein n=1 Tax=Guptibacillus hwajinpoensis TaxID=208199 RepID=A0A4U1MEX0_9BACL|nr:PQQ-binding-like beta-propeller repeat protein [Pseudalkalibacillus hwajinpoensis]TKD69241.1 WD40 repeat domain-containing protein [Pseudalkalibacillus hwajinpoensis]